MPGVAELQPAELICFHLDQFVWNVQLTKMNGLLYATIATAPPTFPPFRTF